MTTLQIIIKKFLSTIRNLQFAKKAIAFTLAETLVVVGIIGVIASLTLPNLNKSTGEKETVAKLQKVYANFSDAYGQAIIKYGPVLSWYNGIGEDATALSRITGQRMGEFLKIRSICDGTAGCFTTGTAKLLNGTNDNNYYSITTNYKMLLEDDTSVYWGIYRNNCADFKASGNEPNNNVCGIFVVDIDGPNKGPYTWGKDLFRFVFAKDGIYPMGMEQEQYWGKNNLSTNCFTKGQDCTGWIMTSGNLDYLKCPSQLSWTKLSCK